MRAATLITAMALGACSSAGTGERASASGAGARTYDVEGFERVALEGSSDVVVRTGLAPSVRAEGDREALDELEIEVQGDTLRVGLKRHGWLFGSGRHGRVKVFITMPSLAAASIGGSGQVAVDRVQGERFEGSIGGSGNLTIDALEVAAAEFAVAGSGDVQAKGKAGRLSANIAGSGNLDLAQVESATASVSVAGSGNARLSASETADVAVMGSGDVTVNGPAKCSVTKAGSGTVRCNA